MYCISIFDRNTGAVLAKMKRASREADIVELRLDLMDKVDLPALISAANMPVLVTYRTTGEGGRGCEEPEAVYRRLDRAMELGADYVDVEWTMTRSFREKLTGNRRGSRIVLSRHLQDRTPGKKELSGLLRDMAGAGPDVVKIVTAAQSIEDNFRVLELIPEAGKLGIPIIAFAMGRPGRVSRLLCVPIGGFITFACLDTNDAAAAGQMPVRLMRRLTEVLLNEN